MTDSSKANGWKVHAIVALAALTLGSSGTFFASRTIAADAAQILRNEQAIKDLTERTARIEQKIARIAALQEGIEADLVIIKNDVREILDRTPQQSEK
jgi:hypothetical protein